MSLQCRPIVPVIKIYGIDTHAQLNRIPWDAMGQHLAGKGKEYRRRSDLYYRDITTGNMANVLVVPNSCIFRAPSADGDVYPPACFPPESVENDIKPVPLVLSDEDMGEVRLHNFISESSFTRPHSYIHSLCTHSVSFLLSVSDT